MKKLYYPPLLKPTDRHRAPCEFCGLRSCSGSRLSRRTVADNLACHGRRWRVTNLSIQQPQGEAHENGFQRR